MSEQLTKSQVCRIPEMLQAGYSEDGIALRLNKPVWVIRNAILFERWKEYEPDDSEPHADRCPDCGGLVLDDLQPCSYCVAKRRGDLNIKTPTDQPKFLVFNLCEA